MTHSNLDENKKILTLAHKDYEKILISYAFLKINNFYLSEDLVQTTFMRTWIYLSRQGKIDIMKSFLYHTLNALIIDEYRKTKNKPTSLDQLVEKGFAPGANYSERLFDILDGITAKNLVKRLPKKYQRVIKMRYIKDLSFKEMSAITKQSKNSLGVQLHRGLKKLKLLFNSL